MFAGRRTAAHEKSLTITGATTFLLRTHLESLKVFLGAFVRIAPHHELIRIIGVFRYIKG